MRKENKINKENLVQWKMKGPVGTLYLVASASGLRGVFWERQSPPMVAKLGGKAEEKILSRAARQLGEYFSGVRRDFDLPLDFSGTSFQKKVWAQLARIPYGQTVAYRDLARKMGKPGLPGRWAPRTERIRSASYCLATG